MLSYNNILLLIIYIMTNNGFTSENIPESNWMKFDQIGDIVKGTLVEKTIKPAEDDFSEQTIYVLTKAQRWTSTIVDKKVTDAQLEEVWDINVGISKPFVNSRMKNVQPWDIIWFAFIQEWEAPKKWYSKPKWIVPYQMWIDHDYIDSLKLEIADGADIFE